MINYNFQEIVTNINNAFFRLESFMNGTVKNYDYFGFNEAFTKLFNEGTKPENFTYDNCKLISEYWSLTEQIRVDYDQSNFENSEAYENEMFCKDCEEIMYLNWERISEFTAFSTPDEIAEAERKFSITDILKAPALPPQQRTTEKEPIRYTAKHYVLAYLIECNAKGESFPIGQKKELEKIGNEKMGTGKGNRFYKVFNEIVNKDLNAENNLIEIGGENWRAIIKSLSSEPETIETYLKSKQL